MHEFELIKNCVKAFNIPQLELEGYEADDIIAVLAEKLVEKHNSTCFIVSSDIYNSTQ